jgi:hypothetical protein
VCVCGGGGGKQSERRGWVMGYLAGLCVCVCVRELSLLAG